MELEEVLNRQGVQLPSSLVVGAPAGPSSSTSSSPDIYKVQHLTNNSGKSEFKRALNLTAEPFQIRAIIAASLVKDTEILLQPVPASELSSTTTPTVTQWSYIEDGATTHRSSVPTIAGADSLFVDLSHVLHHAKAMDAQVTNRSSGIKVLTPKGKNKGCDKMSAVQSFSENELNDIICDIQKSMYYEGHNEQIHHGNQYEEESEEEDWIEEDEEICWEKEFIRDEPYLRCRRGRPLVFRKITFSVPHAMRRRSSRSSD